MALAFTNKAGREVVIIILHVFFLVAGESANLLIASFDSVIALLCVLVAYDKL